MSSRTVFQAVRLLALLCLPLVFSACAPANPAYKASIKADVSERAPVGFPFDVEDFQWSYVDGGNRLQVSGRIKNNGSTARRGVIYALIFDEKGQGVALGESGISPAVLEPGQSGSFSIVAKTSRPQRGRPIKHLRLLTNTQGE